MLHSTRLKWLSPLLGEKRGQDIPRNKEGGTLFSLTATETRRKMAALLLLLLSAGALCTCADAQEAYSNLPETLKKGVDLSLEKLNAHTGIQNHFLFLRSVTQSNVEAGFDVVYIYHHFYLKATRCQKGTVDPAGCHFRNDVPMIDCAICYKTFQGEIEQEPKPYLNCLHKPAVTAEVKVSRVEHCNRLAYSIGATNLLASIGTK
ncbi:uncharacterized protein [Nerophis lumbriciformis]|uniref:uncharacterized protein isoform X2 n=1 Tax=Nerophis lumbriciformis TaxID=546530 RepID=UPI002AE09082|nr:uncharacterized protein LOC133609574 isoform X2 [Nerophis lumbriciformis]